MANNASELRRTFKINILKSENSSEIHASLSVNLRDDDDISTIKHLLSQSPKIKLPENRIGLRITHKGRLLHDTLTITKLIEQCQAERQSDGLSLNLYVKDLGPQISWKTVFLVEYAGPLIIYASTYLAPSVFYRKEATSSLTAVQNVAFLCWTLHYSKRLMETLFVHRFSHGTMPIANLFKNCSYYWGFAAFIGYFCNHPKFTAPPVLQAVIGGILFAVCEIGNLSVHLALKNLRPSGSKERKIPIPDRNPFTALFNYVSCPNYFYEVGSWLGFTVLTNSLPAALFTVVGCGQMALWAIQKHKNYRKEFQKYPKNRKAMIPFIL